MKADIYNLKNEKTGTVDLPDKVFGAKWSPLLIQQVLTAIAANLRRPWAHAKTRAEVRGGGRKPWRQKGTGRARHGSTRSPLWVGGGKSHGPNKERDYTQKVNKKARRAALFSALSKKLKDGGIKIFENLEIKEPKTGVLAGVLRTLLKRDKKAKKYDVLLVAGKENKNIVRASANLQKTKASTPESLNVYDVLNYKNIFMEKDAVEAISKHYKA